MVVKIQFIEIRLDEDLSGFIFIRKNLVPLRTILNQLHNAFRAYGQHHLLPFARADLRQQFFIHRHIGDAQITR